MVPGQWTFSISCRQVFIDTCTLLMMIEVVLKVSSPYNITNCLDVRIEGSDFAIHFQKVVLSFRYFSVVGVLPFFVIRAFTSASNPPCLSMILTSYVNVSTSYSDCIVNIFHWFRIKIFNIHILVLNFLDFWNRIKFSKYVPFFETHFKVIYHYKVVEIVEFSLRSWIDQY